ncbi:MAG: S8 family peptidase [Bacteroidales bacterium]|nr:S8 family peptidase [Bacteroidales bacterium]MCF8390189.1 S8 family peptidase [Bacteroidales bacterium]
MSPTHYWISLKDKDNNTYTIDSPEQFLSSRAISRRQKANIPVTLEDLPVSDIYLDSLRSLGLKITGSSKWFNAVVVETTDTLLIDSIDYLDFVSHSSTEYANFAGTIIESENNSFHFENKLFTENDYGTAYTQLNILGGLGLHELGFKGEGIHIAVLDGGFFRVDSIPWFKNIRDNDQIISHKDFVNPTSNIFNENSHGMSVLSTMAVNTPGQYIGSSPEASFLLLRSEDVNTETKVEEALWLFAAEYADSMGADIITASLGYHFFDFPEMNYDYSNLTGVDALVTRAAEAAFSKGMIVINSAGNQGDDSWGTITTPADGKNVLAIGAIDTEGNVALFSSRGLEESESIKPDVLAVGVETSIITASGTIGKGSGTSFSAPQIAGFTACLWQAMPEKTNLEIINAIRKSASRNSYPDATHGYGIPNFMLALWILSEVENNIVKPEIQIYPNPFQNVLYIKADHAITKIEIYTLSGKLLYSNHNDWKSGEIIQIENVGIESPGIYLLRTENNSSTLVSKIIKQ